MSKPRMQVLNNSSTKVVTAKWLKKDDSPKGRQKFSHPDCEIWLSGQDSDTVGWVIMNALQAQKMRSSALYRKKGNTSW